MKSVQSPLAILCIVLLISATAGAQTPAPANTRNSGMSLGGLIRPYQAPEVAPVNLANSNRLDQLLRAGKLYLSLQDAIALALENNLDIAIQRYGPLQADAALLRAESGGFLRGVPTAVQSGTTNALAQVTGSAGGAGGGASLVSGGSTTTTAGGAVVTQTGTVIPNLDPVLFAQVNTGHRTAPQSNSFTTGVTALTLRNSVENFGIQKGFLTGTTVSYGWNNSGIQTNSPRNDFNPSMTSNMNLSFSQHLLQGFGMAVNNRNIRIAQNNQRVSDLVFKQQVIQTVAAIISAYWDLVSFNENVKVKQQAVGLNQKLYNDNKKQVEIGTLAPIEIVRAEAELASAQQQLTNAETQLLQQETLIKNALSRTGIASPSVADARIIPTDRINVPPQDAIVPVQDLIAQALENRPEVSQTRIQIDNTKIGIKGDKSALLPSLDLVGSLQNNALVGQINSAPLPATGTSIVPVVRSVDPFFIGGLGRALNQIFSRNFPDYSVGFQLSIPLRNRAARADLITDQLQLRQQELMQQRQVNQVRVDVRNALIALQNARAAYEASVKARILQEQTLDAEQKKYALGASTIFFVIQAQRDLTQAQSNEVAAQAAYAKARNQMEMATGRTLEANNVSVDEALKGDVTRPASALPVISQ